MSDRSTNSEPIDWGEVKAFLENQDKNITIIAEGMTDIRPRILKLEDTVDSLVEDNKLFKAAIRTLIRGVGEVKNDVSSLKEDVSSLKEGDGRIEKRLISLEKRLTAHVESTT